MADRSAIIRGPYLQRSILARIEAFFLDNLGKVATREQLIEVSTNPTTAAPLKIGISACQNYEPTRATPSYPGATVEI